MQKTRENRQEQRLCYDWPMRFAGGFGQTLLLGKMIDVSSWGGAFTYEADDNCPQPGQQLTALFSVPRFGTGRGYDMASYKRTCRICRVDDIDRSLRRIAIQFSEPLFFKPGEQGITDSDAKKRLEAVAV